MTTAHASRGAPEASTAGLLISLANSLPASARPLQRHARRLAARLQVPHGRSVDRRASDMLAVLLTAADCAELAGYAEEGLLDSEFDTI